MGVGLGVSGAGGDRNLANEGVRAEAAGKNCGVRRREDYIRAVYKDGADGGIQQVPKVVGLITRPHTGGEVGSFYCKIIK